MEPIEEVLPNNERIQALLNISRLGFDLTRPAIAEVVPDDKHAVITIFRRDDGEDHADHASIGSVSGHTGGGSAGGAVG